MLNSESNHYPQQQQQHQRMKLAPNAQRNNNSLGNSNNHSTYQNQNQNQSFHKTQMLRIYSTETAQEPLWMTNERQKENDPEANSPRSCDNTINTNTESKYDDEELEAAIGKFV
jgi:hypothetical protein